MKGEKDLRIIFDKSRSCATILYQLYFVFSSQQYRDNGVKYKKDSRNSKKILSATLDKDSVTLSFQATEDRHKWAKAPVSTESNGATAGAVSPSTCQLVIHDTSAAATSSSTSIRRRIVVQQSLPVISKLTQNQTCVDKTSKRDFKGCGALEGSCCISTATQEAIGDDKNCDTVVIEKKTPNNDALSNASQAEPSVAERNQELKTPLVDRMLLRPSVIILPSWVTGASGYK